MKSNQQLFKEADNLLDSWEFEAASKIYRELAFDKETLSEALHNLHIAWMLAHLKFLDSVCERFPESTTASIRKIEFLLKDHQFLQAIRLCTELLEEKEHPEAAIIRIRSLRFGASVQQNDNTYLEGDFITIWQGLNSTKAQLMILKELLKVSSPTLSSSIRRLSTMKGISSDVRTLLQLKADSLDMFGRIFG